MPTSNCIIAEGCEAGWISAVKSQSTCNYTITFKKMILSVGLATGMPTSSARKVASEVHVNANTVQHAMIFLVHEGLAESHKGKGYSVIDQGSTNDHISMPEFGSAYNNTVLTYHERTWI